MFVQYTCVMSEDQIYSKYLLLSFFTCLAFLISLVFFIQIRHLVHRQKIDYIEWHLATVTAGAYTVEMQIDQHFYN